MTNEVFSALIRENENSMYAVAYSVLKNDNDAADAIGESILRAYSSLDSLKNEKAFKPWLLKIIHNTCLETLRKRKITLDIDEQYDLADEKASEDHSTRLALRDAVESLRQPYRTVVVLYYYENMSIKEISLISGDSTQAVKKQLSRAREMLKNLIRKEDFFG